MSDVGDEGPRCERCGYSRRGIRPGRPCPECGLAASRRDRRRGRDVPRRVQDLPSPLVRRVRRAAWIAAIAAVASIVSRASNLVGVAPVDPWVGGAIGVAIESTWALGVFLFAAPIQDAEAVERGLGPRSGLRRAARFLQLGWPLGVVLDRGGVFFAGGPLDPVLEWSAVAAWAIGFAGLVVLAVLLIRWSDWMENDEASKWARLYLWCVAGVPAAAVLFVLLGALIAPFMLVAALLGLVCGGGLVFLMPLTIFSIARQLDWAISWQDRRAERDESLRAEVRRRPPVAAAIRRDDDGPLPLV